MSVERKHLLLEPGQFEDILRFVRMNLRVWFCISGLGTNYLSAARHKTGDIKSGDYCATVSDMIGESHNLQTTPEFRLLPSIPV